MECPEKGALRKIREFFAAVMSVTLRVLMVYLTPFVMLTAKELRVHAMSAVF